MAQRARFLLAAVSAVALTAAFGAEAVAQELSQVEEVVVTARKRDESLQDVPVAVSAFTGQQLERQGVRTVVDIARTVPSLAATTSQNSASSGVVRAARPVRQ